MFAQINFNANTSKNSRFFLFPDNSNHLPSHKLRARKRWICTLNNDPLNEKTNNNTRSHTTNKRKLSAVLPVDEGEFSRD